jgi:hypothetical protein
MLKRKNQRTIEEILDKNMNKEVVKENKMQSRLKQAEDKRIAQMEKIEKKKQALLEYQQRKQQEKEFKLQTKLSMMDAQTNRRQTNVTVNVLNKSNSSYIDKLSHVQNALDNDILRLQRENLSVKSVEEKQQNIEEEIERIENERKQQLEETSKIQSILLQKQQTIQTALDQLNDLSIKTNTEYDKLQENKSVKRFELEQAEIKLSLLRKYS